MKTNTHFGGSSLLVLGAEWIVIMVLAGFFGLLGLLFTASVAADHAVSDGIAHTMATIAVVSLALLTWLAVGRLANTQQRLAARLAPSHGGRRAGRGTLTGLLLAWLVCMLPTALLFAALQQRHEALALVCGTALLLGFVAAAACAWQGQLPGTAALPLVAVVVAVFGLGLPALGAAWLQVHWSAQLLALALSGATLWPMLQGSARPGYSAAKHFARWKATRLSSWELRYKRVRLPEEGNLLYLLAIPVSQFYNWTKPGWENYGMGMSILLLFYLLLIAFWSLFSSDLHQRYLLAPGRSRRGALAWRMVGTSLRLTLTIALVMVTIPVLAIAAWEQGLSLDLLTQTLSIVSVLLPLWVFSVVAATWLRGFQGPSWRQALAGLVVFGLSSLALFALTKLGGLTQGPAALCVALLGCALLMPLAQRAWQHKDLSDFIQRPRVQA